MKQTKSKKSMKQFLTLMLAFVMVFTGMGIGSWGVDEAWASGWDGAEISKPSQSEDGTYQISSAAELAWFAGLVNGTLDRVDKNPAANAVLTADINLNEHTVSIGTADTAYGGIFDGAGCVIRSLRINNNVSDSNSNRAFFDTIHNATIKQLEIEGAVVEGRCFGVLVCDASGSSTIFKCAVRNSKLKSNSNTSGIICAALNKGTSVTDCYSLNNSLEYTETISGIAGLVGNAKSNTTLQNCYVAGLEYSAADSKQSPILTKKASKTVIKNCFFASDNEQETTAIGEKKMIAWLKSDEAITALGASYKKDSENKNSGFPVLVYGQKVDKEELKACIDKAEALTDDDVWQEGDRFNGKESEYLPKGSFWAVMTEKLSAAKAVYDSSESTQVAIDTAKDNLQSAIANLIPKTEVNATALYEAIQRANAKAEADYTETSWTPFDAAKSAADAMLGKLYVNGEATNLNRGPLATGEKPEGAIHQVDVDAAAQNLTEAMANLLRRGDESGISETTEFVAKLLPKLITQAETAKKADYTPESWKAFQSALTAAKAAKAPAFTGLASDRAAAETYWAAYENLYSAYYYKLVTTAKFTVQFETVDAANARAGSPATGISESVLLNAGAKLNDLTAKYSITSSKNFYAVMINDVLVSQNFKTLQSEPTLKTGNPILHPGDEVTFIPTMNPQSGMGATLGTANAAPWQYLEWVKKAEFQAESVIEAEAGKAFTVTIEQKAASLGDYTGEKTAASSMSLFLSDVKTERGGQVQTSKLLADGKAVATDENGNAELTLYQEGWYLLQAYDLAEDKIGSIPNYVTDEWSKGEYHSVNSGASVWVHVKASSDADKVKAELKAKLDEVYSAYPQSFFRPENWSLIQTAYETGISGISQAEAIGDARTAQQDAIVTIKQIQQQTEDENERNVNTFRENLNKLPDDVNLITKSVESTVNALLASYEAMSEYQKTLLTKIETEKYENIKKASENGLAEARNYTLTLKIEGDTDEATTALNAMTNYLKENLARQDSSKTSLGTGAFIQKVFSFLNRNTAISEAAPLTEIRLPLGIDYAAYFHVRDANEHTISGDGWSISDREDGISFTEKSFLNYYVEGGLTVKIKDKLYEVKEITYEGIDKSEVIGVEAISVDYSTYKGKDADWVNLHFKDAYQRFTMPYSDVTVTVTWGPVGVKSLAEAKSEALAELETAKASYSKSDYTDANWTKLEQAYADGKTAIENAADSDAVSEAKKNAIGAMAGISKKADTSAKPPELGNEVGKVKVIVENFTANPSKVFAQGWYTLQQDDTMMTLILKALDSEGYTWKGTGGTKGGAKDYTITYLASITDKDGNTLGEFSTTQGSGWMATLNDWFVNFGLQEFGASKSGFCKVENGDEIHAMFTENYGTDIGGSWGDSDTSLKSLTISGGTLVPTFNGSQLEYKLVVPAGGSTITVTPTAANKNYMVRTFLNQYNVDSDCYKRTEYFKVKEGDVIYIGVGDRRWPSMNNNSGYEIDYTGTKYTIQVVSGSDATAVKEMIARIKEVTYGNYRAQKSDVEDARSAYNALTSETKKDVTTAELKKLTDAEAQIKFYSEIDDAKDKLNALTDSSSSSQAKAALSAYEKLSKAQKKYITEDEVKKFNELAKKYNLSTITGATAMPESEVVTEGKAGSAVTTSPTTVKMSGTTATVMVKSDNQKEILKQAKEKKSAQVVLVVANSDAKGAEKLELNLEKSFLESLLKDTNAKLVVKTPLGQKTYERDELQKLVNEATGTTVKAEINKDNVDAQTEEPTEENAAKIEKAKSIVKDMKLIVRSSKTTKKNIKAVLKSDAKVNASIKELKDLGFTVKYRFYRSTKKAASYKSTVTKKTASYTNTSGKKGTKYFYKVQVRVYDENGKLIAKTALKQCKYASRTWTKAK